MLLGPHISLSRFGRISRVAVRRRRPKQNQDPSDLHLLESVYADFAEAMGDAIPDADYRLISHRHPEFPRYLKTISFLRSARSGFARPRPKLCDIGGHVGILGGAFSRLGYAVDVVDNYRTLGHRIQERLSEEWWPRYGVSGHSVDLNDANLTLPFENDTFDVITFMAVIEHLANTPRLVLEEIGRVLRPSGLFILDTPNAGELGLRIGFLLHGEGLWCSVDDLYFSDFPFLGHRRCYSRRELISVLNWAGFEPVEVHQFDLGNGIEEPHDSAVGATPKPPQRLRGKLLYDYLYPLLLRNLSDLRGYNWIASRLKQT
jgi:2-polyprenyl-3-methyl-5-hydroxy-6-metoxy-1,4-benzoquinol methylase